MRPSGWRARRRAAFPLRPSLTLKEGLGVSAQMPAQMPAQMVHKCTNALHTHTGFPYRGEPMCALVHVPLFHLGSTNPILGFRFAYCPIRSCASSPPSSIKRITLPNAAGLIRSSSSYCFAIFGR